MAPPAAARTACCSAAAKAASSVTVWSAGVTTSTGSAPCCTACSAASVMAGAVLRPAGSSSTLQARQCPARATGRAPGSGAPRCRRRRCRPPRCPVAASACQAQRRLLEQAVLACSTRNCFGYWARDSGHSRVPQPPAMMTGCSAIGRVPSFMGRRSRIRSGSSAASASCRRTCAAGRGVPASRAAGAPAPGRHSRRPRRRGGAAPPRRAPRGRWRGA